MTWVTPPTFVTGEVVTAARLNVLSNDLNELLATKADAARASLELRITGSDPTFSSGWQTIHWDTQVAAGGVGGSVFWNGAEAFDLLEAGWHLIVAQVHFASSAFDDGIRIIDVTAGGVVVAEDTFEPHSTRNVVAFQYAPSTEYYVQAYCSAAFGIDRYGKTPMVTAARVL